MIPYILAENPKIERKKAFKLSKEMMKGNKWKTFILDLSFLGWELLSIFTFGLLNIFYINPYKVATTVELYEVLKKQIRAGTHAVNHLVRKLQNRKNHILNI